MNKSGESGSTCIAITAVPVAGVSCTGYFRTPPALRDSESPLQDRHLVLSLVEQHPAPVHTILAGWPYSGWVWRGHGDRGWQGGEGVVELGHDCEAQSGASQEALRDVRCDIDV